MKRSIKHFLFKLKYVFAFVLFAVAITFFGEGSLINRYHQQEEINKLRGEIDNYQRKFNQDNAMLNSLKTDHETLVRIARERYYMKTPDEDIFVIEDEE
ncbi:MAG: septum formation initiator family protein [Bacteroidaceae bacterium]|nr:septum formation initiator family protein [Bacteroidaceae bacterium]